MGTRATISTPGTHPSASLLRPWCVPEWDGDPAKRGRFSYFFEPDPKTIQLVTSVMTL